MNGECVTLWVMFGWLLPVGKFDFIAFHVFGIDFMRKKGEKLFNIFVFEHEFFSFLLRFICVCFSPKTESFTCLLRNIVE